MNIKEFKELESTEEQLKELMKYWGIDEPYLIGTVYNKNQSYMGIVDIQAIGNQEILKNPFNEVEQLKVKCMIESETFNIDYRDKVVFKFRINKNSNYNPIITDSKNISKLINTENIDMISKADIMEQFKNRKIVGNINYIVQDVYIEEKLNKKIEEVENELAKRKEEFEKDLLDKRESGNKELKRLEDKKKKEFKKIDEIELLLKTINKELSEKEELKKTFEKYGFSFENNNKESAVRGKTKIPKDKYIEYIQSYLASREEKPLYYSKEILEQFYAGLCTNQLVVLSGQPGTGKTSLVEGFCNAIAAKLKIISVQPNWTDNQDLLGFFNPIEGTYISTPFLDAIIEAENNPEQLHIICLDEMNLAHVEYYFSEFLSKLQSEDNIITLYSKNLYEEAREEIFSKIELFTNKREENALNVEEGISLLKNIDINEYYKLKKQWKSINTYKNEFKIPSNIRFVGTINKDETTKSLSPKVVDRSYIMEINPYSIKLVEDLKNKIENDRIECKENLYLKANCFKRNTKILSKELREELNALELLLRKFDITLTNRIRQQVNELYGSEIISENNIFDAIVTAKILPKISVEIDFENESLIKDFEKSLSNTIIAKSIFSKMISYWKQCGILTFWR